MIHIRVPGRPVPCPRPRVTGRGVFYSAKYRAWKSGAGLLANVATENSLREPVLAVVRVRVDGRYGDVDNYAKAALDAVQHAAFSGGDDRVVSDLFVSRAQYQLPEDLGMDIELEQRTDTSMFRLAASIIRQTGRGMDGFMQYIEDDEWD